MKEKITIGMLNHNGKQYLKKGLPHLNNLNYDNYEIVIFDNDSTDGSLEFLKTTYPKIKIIKSKTNLGYCVAKNLLVKKIASKYILLLDEDTYTKDKNILDKLIEIYKANNVALLSSLIINENSNETTYFGGFWGLFAYINRPKFSLKKITNFKNNVIKVHSPEGQVVFFEKQLFIDLGGYDESQPYYLDVGDLGIRSSILTKKYNYLALNTLFFHLGISRKTDISTWSWKYRYMFSGAMKILLKNFEIQNVLIYFIPITFAYFFGTFYQFFIRKSFSVFLSYFYSCFLLVKDLPKILKQRKNIQINRKEKDKKFLTIDRPNFL